MKPKVNLTKMLEERLDPVRSVDQLKSQEFAIDAYDPLVENEYGLVQDDASKARPLRNEPEICHDECSYESCLSE